MNPRTQAVVFHLLAPYFTHITLGLLLLRAGLNQGTPSLAVFGIAWLVVLGVAIIGLPFGLCHLIQVLWFAPGWKNVKTQFFLGLLNPSLAALTLVGCVYFLPGVFAFLVGIS